MFVSKFYLFLDFGHQENTIDCLLVDNHASYSSSVFYGYSLFLANEQIVATTII